jgi:hypothetical protein
VIGEPYETFFAHHWYVASNDSFDKEELCKRIDEKLHAINDDYAVERKSALRKVFLDVLPEASFMKFMELKGKVGGQHKFPRVLKGKMLDDWKKFLSGELH